MKTTPATLKIGTTMAFIILLFRLTNADANQPNDSIVNYINNCQYTKALNLIHKSLSNNNHTKQLYLLMGNAYRGLYRFTDAIDAYKKVLTKDTTDVRTIIEIANTYKQIPDYENALCYYTLASQCDTANVAFQFEKTNCKFLLDQYPIALTEYEKLYSKDTSNLFLIKQIAMCYYKTGQNDSSILYYYKALKENPYDAASVSNICNLLYPKLAYGEGIQLTEAYRQLDSTNAKINSLNAYFYLLNDQYRIAINKFHSCMEKKDTSRFIFKNIGIAYFHALSYDTAKFYLEKAYFLDTTDVTNLHFLGLACSKSYYKKLGIEYLEKAIGLYDPTLSKLANLYLNASNACDAWSNCSADKKIAINQNAIFYNPQENNLLYKLASAYDNKKDPKKALELYTQYLNTFPAKRDKGQDYLYEQTKKRIEKIQK
jgi:tetratricopeptide (TPR) repeat protein